MSLRRFANGCFRVLKVTRKPNRKEFTDLVKITGLGLIAIGFIGFTIQVIHHLLTGL